MGGSSEAWNISWQVTLLARPSVLAFTGSFTEDVLMFSRLHRAELCWRVVTPEPH